MNPYLHFLVVAEEAIDELGHVNNVEYVRWMQDAATSHSDQVGCTAATRANGAVWVARSHQIEYLRPAYAGDPVEVRTWIAESRRATSVRRYEFVRRGETPLLARGQTEWVYVDQTTGRPRSIPAEIRALFPEPPEVPAQE